MAAAKWTGAALEARPGERQFAAAERRSVRSGPLQTVAPGPITWRRPSVPNWAKWTNLPIALVGRIKLRRGRRPSQAWRLIGSRLRLPAGGPAGGPLGALEMRSLFINVMCRPGGGGGRRRRAALAQRRPARTEQTISAAHYHCFPSARRPGRLLGRRPVSASKDPRASRNLAGRQLIWRPSRPNSSRRAARHGPAWGSAPRCLFAEVATQAHRWPAKLTI